MPTHQTHAIGRTDYHIEWGQFRAVQDWQTQNTRSTNTKHIPYEEISNTPNAQTPTPKHQKHTIGPTDYDIEWTRSRVAGGIYVDVRDQGRAHAEASARGVASEDQIGRATVVGGGWLRPGDGGGSTTRGGSGSDILDAVDDR